VGPATTVSKSSADLSAISFTGAYLQVVMCFAIVMGFVCVFG